MVSTSRRRSTRKSAAPQQDTLDEKNALVKNKKTAKASRTNSKLVDDNAKNHDLCDACNREGIFLCCDSCPNAFHFACVDPPMNNTEVHDWKGPWYCNECLYRRKHKKSLGKRKKVKTELFDNLLNDLETRNPVAFALPEHIRNYFEGVSTGKNGIYVDATTVKAAKLKNGHYEKQDYFQLKDDHNNYFFCYHCRKTAYKKPMIACDFCNLRWHLDCLTPPMAIPPHPTKKWMCPCHAEHAEKIYHRIPRQPRTDQSNTSHSTSLTSSPSTSTTTTTTTSTNISTEISDIPTLNNLHTQLSNINNNVHYKNNPLHDKSQLLYLSDAIKLNFISINNNNNN
ncbi:unnamed protein product [Cunninghamella echinulata]